MAMSAMEVAEISKIDLQGLQTPESFVVRIYRLEAVSEYWYHVSCWLLLWDDGYFPVLNLLYRAGIRANSPSRANEPSTRGEAIPESESMVARLAPAFT